LYQEPSSKVRLALSADEEIQGEEELLALLAGGRKTLWLCTSRPQPLAKPMGVTASIIRPAKVGFILLVFIIFALEKLLITQWSLHDEES
jgi:hypothetical protein